MPALLICSTARTAALPVDAQGHQTLYVPRHLGRVDLYAPGANDIDLAHRHTTGINLHGGASSVFRAFAPDGMLLLELTDTQLLPMGTVPVLPS
ncbi:hypothetical protein OG824_27690 [Streptomyces prunicolor]|uniref:hypothetical protein n=1 Tax=Streptomyces prunicolor TaxID=67348 RepID=UPI0022569BE2|nr:hypothetical protein [Streptomyces prunicolor]MCX5238988.1 hypothetical protein [Streptomyces prunicolor]